MSSILLALSLLLLISLAILLACSEGMTYKALRCSMEVWCPGNVKASDQTEPPWESIFFKNYVGRLRSRSSPIKPMYDKTHYNKKKEKERKKKYSVGWYIDCALWSADTVI